MKRYTNITLCPKCGDITERRCCNKDLIMYESKHIDFVDSLIPIIKEMNRCSDQSRTI